MSEAICRAARRLLNWMAPHSRRRWVAGRVMLLPLMVVAIHSTQTVPRGPAPQRIEGWVPMRRRRDGRTCVGFQLSGLRSPAEMDTERIPGAECAVSRVRRRRIRLTSTCLTGRNCRARSVQGHHGQVSAQTAKDKQNATYRRSNAARGTSSGKKELQHIPAAESHCFSRATTQRL